MINNLVSDLQLGEQTQPAAIVLLNGQQLPWTSIQVENKNYYMSDTYTIMCPLYGSTQFDLNFWGNITNGEIQIYMGYPALFENYTTQDLTLIFTGIIDVINIDPAIGTVEITGRDYSALLIDSKISNTYTNQTASQIAILFANQNGLTPVVTTTTVPVGIYNQGYTQVSNSITEWDFLTSLAQQINFNLYVVNKELHFEPKPTSQAIPYAITFQLPTELTAYPVSNVEQIKFGRTLTLAGDVIVKIRSNSQTSGKSFTVSATSKHTKGSVTSQKQTYFYSYPNLTPQQANAKAQSILAQITQHELLLSATLPPDFTLTKVTPIQISQTGTVFDQIFYIDVLTRSLDATGGFTMEIEAKNHDTNSQVVV